MPLQSLWLSRSERLQQCLLFDQSNVKRGDQGPHVLLIQGALEMLNEAPIDPADELVTRYGASTAKSVLGFKQKRKIINRSYETEADDIVGRMTIAELDREMSVLEQRHFQLTAAGVPFFRVGLLFAPRIKTSIRGIVVTETNSPWLAWAQTFTKTFKDIGAGMVTIANGSSVAVVANRLKQAATLAGPGGFIVLSVGHGGISPDAFTDEGFFDLGPSGTFRVAGRNAVLVGDPNPTGGKVAHVSAFYDFRSPNPILKGGFGTSREDDDKASGSAGAKARLANWQHYLDVSNTFKSIGLSGVIIMSCRVGSASGFIQRVRSQWGVPIIGYPRRIVGQPEPNGHTRIFLQGDALGTGTNTALGEFLFPLSPDTVVFR